MPDPRHTDWSDHMHTSCFTLLFSLLFVPRVIDFYRIQRDAMITSAERWLQGVWRRGGQGEGINNASRKKIVSFYTLEPKLTQNVYLK